jgi:hypothetical protein
VAAVAEFTLIALSRSHPMLIESVSKGTYRFHLRTNTFAMPVGPYHQKRFELFCRQDRRPYDAEHYLEFLRRSRCGFGVAIAAHGGELARSERFELPTLGIEIRCSIQLSYERLRGRLPDLVGQGQQGGPAEKSPQ